MDQAATRRIREAVDSARKAAHRAKLDHCDVDDVDEVIEAVDAELAKPTPNKNILTRYLNSLARSLFVFPGARSAAGEIDGALRAAGLPATWEQ
ncbi:MAG TPA: hypothetical protein VJQ47_08705 [Steroidobacteraceae bacterium]|nr:hypothetical protein [Steroidobacteraceae bacterium]